MAWDSIRSRRDPAFWVPLVGTVMLALLVGLLAQHWSDAHLASLRTIAASDPEAAVRAFERTLRALAWSAGGFSAVAAGLLARFSQLGLREGRVPPAGLWSLGAHRMATGTTAQRLGRAGLLLAVLLALSGLALVIQAERLIATLAPGG